MRGPGGIVLFAAAALSVLIGGCSGGGSSAAPPKVVTPAPGSGGGSGTSSSGTTSSSPGGTSSTPTSPAAVDTVVVAVPRAARAHTFEGADAFARFYFAQVNRAWTTPDPEALRSLGSADCSSCQQFVDAATEFARKQQHYDKPPLVVGASAWLPESTRSRAIVRVLVIQQAAAIVDPSGEVVDRTIKRNAEMEAEVAWHSVGWTIDGVTQIVAKK